MAEPTTSFDGANGVHTPTSAFAGEAKRLAEDLRAAASAAADTVKQTATSEAGEIGTAAKDIAVDATERLKSAVSEQKVAAADYLTNVSHAIQRAAGEFESDVPQAATYIRRAGGQLENVANAVRTRDSRELVSEVGEFARRQPAMFFGGALLLGFAALRFLKSAPSTVQSEAHIQ